MTRIGVAATAPFGADVLERLADEHDVAWVLTRPDRPAGRGRKPTPPAAKTAAERLGLEVRQPERPTVDDIAGVDTIVLVAYGVLIPDELLQAALWLNVHPSLLPRWRGAAPVERALLAGDEETGVTIIKLVKELDAGPIAAQQAFPIEPEDDAGAVYARSAEVAAGLLDEVLAGLAFREQEGEPTYAQKLEPNDRQLDFDGSRRCAAPRARAVAAHRRARGAPRPPRDDLAGARRRRRARAARGAARRRRRMTYEEFLRGLR